jgi:predicted TIM-barrel fold metal-dependent hydrolase
LFGIPLQQQWSYSNSGDFAPTYYLHTDAPLYYYSFTDAYIASVYRTLSPAEQARFDPMITGFNPADMYGVDHIRRVLKAFPGVFTGIGEFSVHKEFVSSKVAGETASLTNPALDRILDFAAEAGLVVIFHNDIDMPFAKEGAAPVYLDQMKGLLKRHPKTTVIWAHTGLGRIVHPVTATAAVAAAERSPAHLGIVESILADPAFNHVSFDISWDEVAKYAIASPESIQRVAAALNKYPDRFLFGTDTVAPAGPAPYYAVFDMWAPIWKLLTPETSLKVRKSNYERVFNEGRRRVREWEKANVK